MDSNRNLSILLALAVAGSAGLVPALGAQPTPFDALDESLEAVRVQLKTTHAKLRSDVKENFTFRGEKKSDKGKTGLKTEDIPFPVLECCSTDLEKISTESVKMRAIVSELNATFTLDNNADGLQAVRDFSKGLDAMDSALKTFASSNSKQYAETAFKSVRLVYGETVKLRAEIDRAAGRVPPEPPKESGGE